jgi:hypothetical protein
MNCGVPEKVNWLCHNSSPDPIGLYASIKSPSWKREEEKLADKISNTPCPFCGSVFGSDAVEFARKKLDDAKKEAYEEREHNGCILFSDEWDIICPSCRKETRYNLNDE